MRSLPGRAQAQHNQARALDRKTATAAPWAAKPQFAIYDGGGFVEGAVLVAMLVRDVEHVTRKYRLLK